MKPTNLSKHKPNKRTKSTKISSLFPKRGNRNTKRTKKHKNKMTHGKTYNKSLRRINHKATKNKTNTGKSNFSEQFRKLINRYKRIGYSLDIMRQTACLVVNPIIVDDYASGLRLNDGFFVKCLPVGWGLTICLWHGPPWFNCWFSLTLAYRRISHAYSSLFIIVIDLIFILSLRCID